MSAPPPDLPAAVAALRAQCNAEIQRWTGSPVAVTANTAVPFGRLNALLRACDGVFRAWDLEQASTEVRVL